jgi:predicted cobalt transporter CbtA
MFKRSLLRGVTAGAIAGLAYGCYVAVIATPLIGYAETFETGSESSAVPELVTALASIAGGALYGILLGTVAFGVAFYVLEPALPGTAWTRRYLLAAAGFLVVSGVPWLVLPPVPPGVEQSLPTDVRLGWYVTSMAVGVVACGLAITVYNGFAAEYRGRIAPVGAAVGLVPVIALLFVAPGNEVSGSVPDVVATVFTVSTAAGQIGLWTLLATVDGWLVRRSATRDGSDGAPSMDSRSL